MCESVVLWTICGCVCACVYVCMCADSTVRLSVNRTILFYVCECRLNNVQL